MYIHRVLSYYLKDKLSCQRNCYFPDTDLFIYDIAGFKLRQYALPRAEGTPKELQVIKIGDIFYSEG
jgi:hypothetical protein